jgi:hypothetical protein
MKHSPVALHLVSIGLLFVAASGMAAAPGSSTGTPAGIMVDAPAAPPDGAPGVDPPASAPPEADRFTCDPPSTGDFTPVACKMEPQCSDNSDCVAWCGLSGGHCVHSSCPIRICKCN